MEISGSGGLNDLLIVGSEIVQQDLAVFLQSYLPQQPMGEQDEITADDR